jgi:hypothetical protein
VNLHVAETALRTSLSQTSIADLAKNCPQSIRKKFAGGAGLVLQTTQKPSIGNSTMSNEQTVIVGGGLQDF